MALFERIAVLIDLSGTLHVDDLCIAGASAALQRLRRNPRFALRFVTNTTKVSHNIPLCLQMYSFSYIR